MTTMITESGENTGVSTYEPVSDTKLKLLADDYLKGRIFGSWDIPKKDIHLLPKIFITLSFIDDITNRQIVTNFPDGYASYEYKEKSNNRTIDQYSLFMSCYLISDRDLKRLLNQCEQIIHNEKNNLIQYE